MNLERVQDLHARALAMEPAERGVFLDEACGGDAELRAEVGSLLAARERMEGFLERPAAQAVVGKPLAPGSLVGSYEIVRVLGAGGAGTVYEALQASPHRRVALKMLRSRFGSETAQRRFRDEAEILARLKHPSIATIYEAGVHDGLPWFAMEHVEGARNVIQYAEGLDRRQRLTLFASICNAVHHGHQRGIIHRDLKPANVLVDETGRPKVIDFGVARIAGASEEGEIAGTPAYMSPEQCEPGRANVDVRSDVYALGVLLHELLAGRVPRDVDGLSITEATRRIREEPLPPIGLRGDLGAIAGRALAADREQRYASAAALADDVRRHLEDHPVEARAGGLLYHVGKFARRERFAFLAIVAVLLVLVAAAVVSRRQAEESEFRAYIANVAAAAAALRVNDVRDARQRLERAPEHLRGWEWHHFHRRLDVSEETLASPGGQVYAGALSGNGEVIAAAGWGRDFWVILWEGRDRKRRVLRWEDRMAHAIALDSSGRRLVVGFRDGGIEIHDVASLDILLRLEGHEATVNAVAFHPRDRLLVSASSDGTVKLWDLEGGALLRTLSAHEDRVIAVAFDPAGSRLASGGREGALRIWDTGSGHLLRDIAAHAGSVEGVAWSPDGSRLVSVSRDRSLRIWDPGTGALLAAGRGPDHNIRAVAFSPDGRTVATASYDYTTRLWRAADAVEIACLRGHTDMVRAVLFEPGGRRLVSFSADGTVRIWAATERGGVPALLGHTDWVGSISFSAGGHLLASGSRDGTVRLWDPETEELLAEGRPGETGISSQAFHPAGHLLAAAAGDEIKLLDGRTLAERAVLRGHTAQVRTVTFSPDGTRVASGGDDRTVRLWDVETGTEVAVLHGHRHAVRSVAFSSDGRRLASADGSKEGRDSAILLWERGD